MQDRENPEDKKHEPDAAAYINTSRSLNRGSSMPPQRHAASSTDAAERGDAHNEPPRRHRERGRSRRAAAKEEMPLWLPFAVVMAIIAVISGVVVYGVNLVNKVEDSIRPDDSTPTVRKR
ncbi:MAG: hypothetical protein ACLTNY_00180 [Blautia massiliensis (ex Durand et al. 2017)]